ncbi:hypothetical protein [Streptomyces neyagawaensis]|uniref:hypothetical protein n=1 Tax=Streptomyces neyagawaensis TaxID=42238 RepID=UPI0006E151DD|nr:hypothetical protein [Streptomyces neyagawaensis]MCL6733259.1 hypothetical protein [Streptomyces neyagawaensis]MDE1685061.1 hypothetical protein [Streptomyces neyagawaensis]
MKSLKAAVVVTGSLIIAGAAAPAFAQNATEVVHKNLNDAVRTLDKGPVQTQPLRGGVLDAKGKGKKKGALLTTVERTSTALGTGTPLLGGLPQQK